MKNNQKQKKILVVDDSQMICESLKERLSGFGYAVETTKSGEECLEMLLRRSYDLITLDNIMPGLSGLDVLRQIRLNQSQANLAVIIFTTKDSLEEKKNAFNLGADDYVLKSVDMVELEMRIESHLKRREMEKKIQEMQEKLNQALLISSLARATAGIAHEMRQPLTAADLNLAEAIKRIGDREINDLVSLARERVKEALLIIRSMLKVFRGTKRQALIEKDLNSELKEAVYLFGKQKTKRVEFVYDFCDRAVIKTCGNPSRIFINLISNALDALPLDWPNKKIQLITRSDNNNVLTIVEDSGIGIPPENLEKIFEPEFTTKKSGEGGTGLGLWIAKMEMEQMQGKIDVESEVGKFTRFYASFPKSCVDYCSEENCENKERR